jgi:hypothetical protein
MTTPSTGRDAVVHGALRSVLVLAGLYLLALAIRLVAAGQIPMPGTEPSAYYADVAGSLVRGQGLVSHAVWSYATGPLVVPKPAFELWLPMSSLVSALSMTFLGPTWWAAQVGSALLGALVAPLTWAVARGAARGAGLDARRTGAVAIASGVLAAILGPLVLASAVPDSYLPYLVFSLMAVLIIPPWLGIRDGAPASPAGGPTRLGGMVLGVLMGLAYLSRQEAIWLGLTLLLVLAWALRSRPPGTRLQEAVRRLWPVVVGALLVVVPWLARNTLEFGSPFPGQALENMVLVRNEDIFAFADRPNLGRYLDQGLATVLGNPVAAAWAGFRDALLLPAFPIGLIGLVALLAMHRSSALRRPTALVALLASGILTFVSTALLFPVATRWGTFLHASGPLLVALLVMAVLGSDALLARISRMRGWRQANVVIGPVTLIIIAAVLGSLQLSLVADQSRGRQARYTALASAIASVAEQEGQSVPATIITDHPMWIADALDRDAIVLPDEDLASVMELSRRFEAPWIVVVDGRGRYPTDLLDPGALGCQDGPPVPLEQGQATAWLIRLSETCPAT